MFEWLFGGGKSNSTDNNRSVVNAAFSLSKDMCAVGIYISDKSRVILMESGVGPTRKLLEYSGDLDFIPEIDQPLLWNSTLCTANNWREKIAEFTKLRSSARTIIDFQLTADKLKIFKEALGGRFTTGHDNPFDQSIHAAAAAIGKTIYLDGSLDDSCRIS